MSSSYNSPKHSIQLVHKTLHVLIKQLSYYSAAFIEKALAVPKHISWQDDLSLPIYEKNQTKQTRKSYLLII